MADKNKFKTPEAPPSPMFFNQQERDYVKQISDEVIERITGIDMNFFSLDVRGSNYHPLYGEAIHKIHYPAIVVKALVDFRVVSVTNEYGVDKTPVLTVFFHKRRLVEDQQVEPKEGDIIQYGVNYFKISSLIDSRELFGQNEQRYEIAAICSKARRGDFNG